MHILVEYYGQPLVRLILPRNMAAILRHFAHYGVYRISARERNGRRAHTLVRQQFFALVAAKRTAAAEAQREFALLSRKRILPVAVALDLKHKKFVFVFEYALR